MESYLFPIQVAAATFPFIALLFTLPYVIWQYRKFERIPVWKVIVTYSFIFYMISAYYLVILPLPTIESVAKLDAANHVLLEPLQSLRAFITKSNLSLAEKDELITILRSEEILQLCFNVLLVVPFGMYMRYYFRRNWWQTLLLSFGLSLFFELTQLTGLYWIYPQPYRYFELDDLICNTLGGMVGFWIAPALHLFLPDKDALDAAARRVTPQVSIIRRIVATIVDWAIVLAVYAIAVYLLTNMLHVKMEHPSLTRLIPVGCAMVYEIVCSAITGGYTPGKALLRLRVMTDDGKKARLWQYCVRYSLLYGVIYAGPLLILAMLAAMPGWPTYLQYLAGAAGLALAVLFFLFAAETVFKLFGGQQPYRYDRLSRTRCYSVKNGGKDDGTPVTIRMTKLHPSGRKPR